jgi:hypothetical protein
MVQKSSFGPLALMAEGLGGGTSSAWVCAAIGGAAHALACSLECVDFQPGDRSRGGEFQCADGLLRGNAGGKGICCFLIMDTGDACENPSTGATIQRSASRFYSRARSSQVLGTLVRRFNSPFR